MYIEPFWAGVVAVIVCEILVAFMYSFHVVHSQDSDESMKIMDVQLSEDEKDELLKCVSEIMEKRNGKDNSNQSK